MNIFNKKRVAIIRFSGTITSQNIAPYIDLLKKIEGINSIKGIIFIIDSPGGSAIHSELLYFALERLKKKGKKLYGYLEIAASGGYLAACALERLYAPPSAIIGSIGVISLKPVLKDILGKLGVDYEVLKKGKYKDMWLFTRKYTDEERASIDELQEDIYSRFIEIVSKGRNIHSENVLQLATGELFSAKKSITNRLIDEISDIDKTIDDICKEVNAKPEKVIYMSIKKPFFQKIIGKSISKSILNTIEDIYYNVI